MKARYGSLALALLFVTGSAWAEEDGEQREDPWEYDKAKSEKRERAEQEEQESERTFGSSGDFAISAERLIGFVRTAYKIKVDGPDQKATVNRLQLLLNQTGDVLTYSSARIAFDVFVTDGFSLGGSLGYSSSADDDVSAHQFLVAPRVGYALMFSDMIGIWPRVGVTYQDQKTPAFKAGILAASVELPLVLAVAPQTLITVGPSLDLTIVGKYNPDGAAPRVNYSQDEFGFTAGMTLFF